MTSSTPLHVLVIEDNPDLAANVCDYLEAKGHVRHENVSLRYVYSPTVPRHAARRSALRHLVDTFFDGSPEKVVAALLGGEAAELDDRELDRILALVHEARGAKP